ncbi:hypothetical protein Agub_g8239, partial [Astrephomene gubernaculifera]
MVMTQPNNEQRKSAWPDLQQTPAVPQNGAQHREVLRQGAGRDGQPVHAQQLQQQQQHLSNPDSKPSSASQQQRKRTTTEEVDPRNAIKMVDLRHKAITLIQRHAGTRWREAQRTKWLIDLVCAIDRDYRERIAGQEAEIAALQKQLQQTNGLHAAATDGIQTQNDHLRRRVGALEVQLRAAQGAVLDMQTRIRASELALDGAEEAARTALEECQQLQQAVSVLAAHDASARKLLAARAHVMREALLASRGRMRQAAEQSRQFRAQASSQLSQQRRAAEQERAALQAASQSSLAAAATLHGAASRLALEQVLQELEAYKEPWAYVYG